MLRSRRHLRLVTLALAGCCLFAGHASADGDILSADQIAFRLSQSKGLKVSGDSTSPATSNVDLPGVTFDFNSSTLTASARKQLDELAKALSFNLYADKPFLIAGHTDATGSEYYNKALSEKRALATKTYLATKHGIDQGRIETNGFGEQELLSTVAPDDGRQRRVEIRVIK